MKAADLRIGNYHEYLVIDKVDERQEYWQIGQIDWQDLKYLSEREERLSQLPNPTGKAIEHYRAVALTEEILLKCGFYKCDDSWYFSLDFAPNADTFKIFPLTSGGKPNGMWAIAGMPQLYKKLEYLHHLQNLFFSLTGQELTFNN